MKRNDNFVEKCLGVFCAIGIGAMHLLVGLVGISIKCLPLAVLVLVVAACIKVLMM